jgi:putative component of membrane protein insertase Oxa1/YidC/SpoIIIJ protein YidD
MKSTIKNLLFILITITLVTTITAQSQLTDDMMLIISYNPLVSQEDSTINHKSQIKIPENLEDLGGMSIKFYQYFISSQDLPSCVFTPSCSRFAEQSIHNFGILKGILLTSDRLQRCNSFGDKSNWYTFNFSKKRFNDPVDHYGETK